MFNHRAILAEWFKGTDSKNDALVFGKLIHAGRCPAQTNITSHCVPVCRGGVHPHRGGDVGRSGGGHHPHHLVVWGGHCPEGWPTRLHYLHQTSVPPCCYCPVAGEFHPLDASPSNPPPHSGWFIVVCVCELVIVFCLQKYTTSWNWLKKHQ